MLTSCKKSLHAAFMVVFCFALGLHVYAQSGGSSSSISGTVLDPSGAVVANASVEIHNPVSGYDRTTTTDSKGNFSFTNVPFNPYHMTVKAAGFAQYAQDVETRSVVPVTVKVSLTSGQHRHGYGRVLRAIWWRTIRPSTPTSTRSCSTGFPWKARRRR